MKAPTPTKELLEEGNYVATVYRIIYMGTVEGEYRGTPNSSFKVNISWELPNEMKVWKEGDEPKPAVISKTYTLSMGSKSNLRPIVEGIMGGMSDAEAYNFDLDEILGKSCLLNVTHGVSETGKEKINLVTSKLIKGMEVPKGFNNQVIFDYGKHWNEELFASFPQWLRDEMSGTVEFKMKTGTYEPTVQIDTQKVVKDDGSVPNIDDIPF